MADSKYPNELDTDVELPRVDDNIVEIGGDAINGLRSAVFNIEQTLGVNPQGTAADMAARLNQSLNPDGTIKASALSTIGLVTLPITDSMVATNAGILESKLDLNYPTKILRELIGALRVEHDALVVTVQGDITNLSRHVAHPTSFGRHRTSDIDGYIGAYAGYNLQGVINDLDTRIIDHLADPIDAHDASAISFDDTDTFISADEVQTAIEKLDALGITTLTMHQDEQHSNGILSTQKVIKENGCGEEIVASAALNAISAGATVVAFTSVPSELSQVIRGDRIDITIGSDTYTRNVDKVDTTFGTVTFFSALSTGGIGATAAIHRTTEESWAPSSLNLTIRHDKIATNQGGSVLQLIHPSSPFILSNGLDTREINATSRNIKLAWANGETVEIDAYQALQTYPTANNAPSTWTPENLAIALNEEFKKDANNYPLVAFSYRGEVGFAFDEPDGYVALRAPAANSAWGAFGLSGTEIDYSLGPRRFYIDGYNFSGLRKIVDATGITDNSTVIKNINVDLTGLGVGQTGIVRLKNHTDAGTYVFNASSTNSLTISSHVGGFTADTNVSVEIYADSFAVPITPTFHTLYELFIDAYGDESGELRGAARVEYIAGGSSVGTEDWFNIVEISRDFSDDTKRIHIQNVGGEISAALGDPITVPVTSNGVTDPGPYVTLPTTNEEGYRFRLYHYNRVDYVDIEIASGGYTSIPVSEDRAINLTTYRRISEEKYVQVGQVLHDASTFKHLSDRRLLGTIGRKDIRNDYTRDYIAYPRSLLRGNGVINGCFVNSSLTVYGGQVLVDGNIYAINRTELTMPTDDTTSTYNVFVDSEGVLRFLQDNQHSLGLLTTPSAQEIVNSSDKTLLAQVDINGSSGTITDVRDCRRFVNNMDNKVELLVEQYDVVQSYGSFAALRSAISYFNLLGADSAVSMVCKIRGTVICDVSDGPIVVPDGMVITGETSYLGSLSRATKLVLTGSTSDSLFEVGQSVTFRNLRIESEAGSSCPTLIGNASADLNYLTVENCRFTNLESTGEMYILRANNVTALQIRKCWFSLSAANGTARVLGASGNATAVTVDEVSGTFTSGTNSNALVSIDGNTQRLTIKDLYISFPTPGAGYSNVFVSPSNGDLSDSRITDVIVTAPSASNQSLIFGPTNMHRCIISGCSLQTVHKLVDGAGNLYDCTFKSNLVWEAIKFLGCETMDEVFIFGNSCGSSGTITDYIEASVSATHVTIYNNVFELSGTVDRAAVFELGSDVYVKNNMFTISGSTDTILDFNSGQSNIFVEGNVFSCLGEIDNVVELNTDMSYIFILNNVVTTTDPMKVFVAIYGTSSNVTISGNIVNVPADIIENILRVTGDAQNLVVFNNSCVFNGTSGSNSMISIEALATNLYIQDNTFITNSSVGTSGEFILCYDVTIGQISRNLFNITDGIVQAAVKIGDAIDVIIDSNICTSSSTTGAEGVMIHITQTSNRVNVINNILLNSSGGGQGFESGVVFAGGGGTPAGDHMFTRISGNVLANFFQGSSTGMSFLNASTLKIDGNIIGGASREPLLVEDSTYVTISNNNILSTETWTLKLDGPNITSAVEGVYVISNNILVQFSFTPDTVIDVPSGPNADFLGVPGFPISANGIINNNIIMQMSTSLTSTSALIDVATDHWMITHNYFHTSVFGAGITYSVAPITTTGERVIVAFNNMRSMVSSHADGMVTVSGAGSKEYMNWGQTYSFAVPMKPTDYGSSWNIVGSTEGAYFQATSYVLFSNKLLLQLEIPPICRGSVLKGVNVATQINGSTGELTVHLVKQEWNDIVSGVILKSEDPVSGVGVETLIDPTTLEYIDPNWVYGVTFEVDSGISGTISVYGAKLEIIL